MITIKIKLEEAFDFLKGKGNRSVERLKGTKHHVITYSDCLRQEYPTFIRKVNRTTDEEGTPLEVGDILIPTANLPKGEISKIAYLFCGEEDCVAGEGLHILRKKINIDPYYACCQINAEPLRHKLYAMQLGSTIQNLYAKDIKQLTFTHPIKFDHQQTQKVNHILIALEEKLELEKEVLKNYTKQKDYFLKNMLV